MSEEDVRRMAERMRRAFKEIQCFVFEREELELVKEAVRRTGLKGLVRLRMADPRYPYLFILEPDTRDCERDCEAKAYRKIADGEVREELKKYFIKSFMLQCIDFCVHEKTKEILSILDKYLGKGS